MKPKSQPLEKSDPGFDSQTFWRHYVATVDTNQEWAEERPQQGRGSNRLFLFLLLFHIFLIGSVVLYNLVSERPKPMFVDNSAPQKPGASYAKKSVAPVTSAPNFITADKQPEIVEHRVAHGDSLKSIADASGATQDEIARLNEIDVNTQLSVGSVLRVPKSKSKTFPTVIPVAMQPSRVDEKFVTVQATTAASTARMFAAEPEAIATKLPEEAPKGKVEDAPPPAPKAQAISQVDGSPPPARPTAPAKVEETPPAAKPKSTEAKAIARTESPPTRATKPADTAKSGSAKPAASSGASKPAVTGSTHTVKPKETFYSISRKYGVKVDELMRVNGVTDPGKLREGVVLKVPK